MADSLQLGYMELTDTHCHIHFPDYELDPEEVIENAKKTGVTRLVCVGCTLVDSRLAVEMADKYKNIWATIGLHPHESSQYVNDDVSLQNFRDLARKSKVVAIGETGLDYYYKHSPKSDQKKLFRFQLELALEHGLPLIFHVRDAFDEFFAITSQYKGIKGVVHSFTADRQTLDKVLSRGLYVGLNGIVTFAKDNELLESAKALPLEKMLLETDAPFLTPAPFRGRICEPKHVRVTAEFLSRIRGESLERLSAASTQNAMELFNLEAR